MDGYWSETVEKLKYKQKIISRKVLELSNSFKVTIARLEKTLEDKFAYYETRINELENEKIFKFDEKLDSHAEEIEALKKDEVNLSDDVSNLEAEREHISKIINTID